MPRFLVSHAERINLIASCRHIVRRSSIAASAASSAINSPKSDILPPVAPSTSLNMLSKSDLDGVFHRHLQQASSRPVSQVSNTDLSILTSEDSRITSPPLPPIQAHSSSYVLLCSGSRCVETKPVNPTSLLVF